MFNLRIASLPSTFSIAKLNATAKPRLIKVNDHAIANGRLWLRVPGTYAKITEVGAAQFA
jgi:hypothetical protein